MPDFSLIKHNEQQNYIKFYIALEDTEAETIYKLQKVFKDNFILNVSPL